MEKIKNKFIQDEIENDVRKVFDKMEKPFHDYFGKLCPVFEPECVGCQANFIFSKFKKELWEECVRDKQEGKSAPKVLD